MTSIGGNFDCSGQYSGTMAPLEIAEFPLLKRKTIQEITVRLTRDFVSAFVDFSCTSSVHATTRWRRVAFLMGGTLLALIAVPAFSQTIRVDITPDHVANKFAPNQALGAGIDRMSAAAIDKL